MKGYVIDTGYMGYVDGEYELFATEEDYYEYMVAQHRCIGKRGLLNVSFFCYNTRVQQVLKARFIYIQEAT